MEGRESRQKGLWEGRGSVAGAKGETGVRERETVLVDVETQTAVEVVAPGEVEESETTRLAGVDLGQGVGTLMSMRRWMGGSAIGREQTPI